ncbi:hypothetical protein GGF32_004048 [Allomyces javanicus]|nr:hypothetical protein GGF32_004048 [Allomyces javanicus]
MQAPIHEPIQADHDDSALLARLSELKALEDKSEYHALASQFIRQQAEGFLGHCKNGDLGTYKSDKTFITHHFPHLHVTNMDQVEQYYKDKGLAIATVRGHYGKLKVFLVHIRNTKSTTLFEDVEQEYCKRGTNLAVLAMHQSKEKELPTTMDRLLDQCNSLCLSKVPIEDYLALKLVCYFSLRGDPGHIKLQNYDESRDLYVKDGKIHLRIMVKDKKEHYKDVCMVYMMTPEEKKALDQFMTANPTCEYLFTSQASSTLQQRTGNFNTKVQWCSKRWFGTQYGVSVIRKMAQTKFASMMHGKDGLKAAQLWDEYAQNRGHTLRTVMHFELFKKAMALVNEMAGGS